MIRSYSILSPLASQKATGHCASALSSSYVSTAQKPTTLSAATTDSANAFGVPQLAFLFFKSSSVTPRVRPQPPQTEIVTPLAVSSAMISAALGTATPFTSRAMLSFIR